MTNVIELHACPRCGAAEAALPIVYGYPSKELFHEAAIGRVVLGGCCVVERSPRRRCPRCGHSWGLRRKSRGSRLK